MNVPAYEQLTLFPEDSPASLFPLPGSDEARKMTVTSGRRCCELLRSSGPAGCLVKMLLGSSIWRSTRCFLTWKLSATPGGRLLFRLVPSTPSTEGTAARSWPTPTVVDTYTGRMKSNQQKPGSAHSVNLADAVKMWPTPSASDCGRTAINPHLTRNGTIRHIGKNGHQSYARLDAVAAMFPTPTASEAERGGKGYRHGGLRCAIQEENGQLNPVWVEWLMGFPPGWTDV